MGRACGSCFPQQLETPQLSRPRLGSAAQPHCPLQGVCPMERPDASSVAPCRGCRRGTEVPASPTRRAVGTPLPPGLSLPPLCTSPPARPSSPPGSEPVLGQGGRGSVRSLPAAPLSLPLSPGADSSLLGKDSPPTPTMYKYRPGYSSSSSSAALPHSTSAKLSRVNSLKEPNSICDGGHKPSYRSEPSLEPESFRSPTFGKSFHFDPLSSGSRSSSLKSAQGTGFETGHLQSIRSEGTTSTSYKSLVNQTRNGSLSYDSLLTPSDSPDFESVQAGPEPEPPVGYTSPFLSARIAQQRETDLHGRFASAASPKHAAPPREPSPVRYDNLSRHIVASIQEREKLLQQPPAPGREEDAGLADSGIQSTPGSSNAPRTSSSSDDSKRSPLGKNPLTRPALPRFGKPEPPPALRVRSLGSPDQPAAPHLGKSVSYSSQKTASQAGGPETEEVALQPLLAPKDEVQMRTAYSKSNGQPKSLGSAPPGPGPVPLSSPTRGGVKKVSGVGGTTYEISV